METSVDAYVLYSSGNMDDGTQTIEKCRPLKVAQGDAAHVRLSQALHSI